MAHHYKLGERVKLTADYTNPDGRCFVAGQMGTVRAVGYGPVFSPQLDKQVVNYLLYIQFDDGWAGHVPQGKVKVT